jgi:hypothetical protein
MTLFRMTYTRAGQHGQSSLSLCRPGIVSALELAAKLSAAWELTNWELRKVPFRKHTRR